MIKIRNAWLMSLWVLLVAYASAINAAVPAEEVKRIPFKAQVTVKPDGTAELRDIPGVKDPLATFIRKKVAATGFIPGRRDGKPGTATAELSGVLVLTPADADNYQIGMEEISLAPRSRHISPPAYPRGMSRHGNENSVLLLIRIKADGSVVPVRVIHSTSTAFEKPTLDQARKWKFEAQTFDGIPIAVEAPILVRFNSGKVQGQQQEFVCVWDELRPRMEGQSCLLDGLTITKL